MSSKYFLTEENAETEVFEKGTQNPVKTAKEAVELAAAKETAEKLSAILLTFKRQAGADGRLYGSVTTKEIAEELEKQHKIVIDKRKIQSNILKAFGKYELEVKLHTEVTGKLNVLITDEK